MKIFHIITSLKLGGAESFLYQFLSCATKNKQEKHVVAYFHYGPYVNQIENLGIKTYQIKGLFYKYDFLAYHRLKKLIKKETPDIIQTSLWAATILGRLIGKELNIPVICEVHGDCTHVTSSFKNWLDKKTITIPHTIIAVSDHVKVAYEKEIIGSTSSRLMVIKNGIDGKLLHKKNDDHPLTRQEIGLHDKDFIIGSVGRLEAIKSYDLLIQAFAYVQKKFLHSSQQLKLCLVGDGSQQAFLKELVAKLSIADDVIFMGERTDAYCFYPLFNCFALSSQTEGLSIALLEALTFGLPIITTHRDKKHEVLQDGIHGLLVPVNDVKKYAEALEKMYLNHQLRDAMRQENRLLSKKFSIETVVNNYRSVYCSAKEGRKELDPGSQPSP